MKTAFILSLAITLTAFVQPEKPLVVVNGIPINPNANFANEIPIDQIVSLKTYEPAEAISLYGQFLGSNGIVEIKTKLTSKGFIDIPADSRLMYGDAKPVVVLNGKRIEYEKLKDVESEGVLKIEVTSGIDYVKDWGPQAINGLVKVTTTPN